MRPAGFLCSSSFHCLTIGTVALMAKGRFSLTKLCGLVLGAWCLVPSPSYVAWCSLRGGRWATELRRQLAATTVDARDAGKWALAQDSFCSVIKIQLTLLHPIMLHQGPQNNQIGSKHSSHKKTHICDHQFVIVGECWDCLLPTYLVLIVLKEYN